MRHGVTTRSLLVLLLLPWILLSSSCDCLVGSDDECEPTYFQVAVDSLTYEPGSPAAGDTLYVRFWGYIGSSTCERFWRFTTVRDSRRLTVEAWGQNTCERICGATMQYLQHEWLEVSPLYGGPFVIAVRQPDGSELADTLLVAQGSARPN